MNKVLQRFRKQIENQFSLNNLQVLAFDLNIKWGNLAGNVLSKKIIALIEYSYQHDQLSDLIAYLAEKRPHISWPTAEQIIQEMASQKVQEGTLEPPKARLKRLRWIIVSLLILLSLIWFANSKISSTTHPPQLVVDWLVYTLDSGDSEQFIEAGGTIQLQEGGRFCLLRLKFSTGDIDGNHSAWAEAVIHKPDYPSDDGWDFTDIRTWRSVQIDPDNSKNELITFADSEGCWVVQRGLDSLMIHLIHAGEFGWEIDYWFPVKLEVLPEPQIAFHSTRDGNPEIYLINIEDNVFTRLTNNDAEDSFPVWSPGGTKIAFRSNRDGNFEIYVMNADGSEPTRLTHNSGEDSNPSWSPNGEQIAFHSNRDGNFEIYIMNADGSEPIRLTNDEALDFYPAWSPDGTKIAFVSERAGRGKIYIMNPDGSNITRLTEDSNFGVSGSWSDTSPTWLPNGRLAFHRLVDEATWEIFLMNSDGSGQIHLKTEYTGCNHFSADWSSDGAQIAFDSNVVDCTRSLNTQNLYIMNADGTGLTQLTQNQDWNSNPSWRP